MLLVILLIAIVDFFIGTFIPRSPTSEDSYRGFTGYSGNFSLQHYYRVYANKTEAQK